MGMRVMLVVIFVLVISLAVSQSPDFKKLSEKNLKQQYICSDPLQLQCMDGTCATWCDGHPECEFDEDEMWCDKNMTYGCADPMQSTCSDGSVCAYWCDDSWECADGEDEMWCGDMNYASSTHKPSDVSIYGNGFVSVDDICIGYETYSSVASHDFCRDFYYAYGYMKKNITTRSIGKTLSNKDLKSMAYQIVRARHDKKLNADKMKQDKRDPHISDKRHGNEALETRIQTNKKKMNDRKPMRKKEYMKKKGDKGTLENLTNLLTEERDIELTPRGRGCNKKLLYCQVKLHEISEGKCPTMTSSDNHLGPMQKKENMKKKGDKGTLENLKNLLTVERDIELTPHDRINLIISPDMKPLNTDDGWDDDLCRY
ncbi:Hypothetical predicted protein [Mytilus galloprovincialis]|uniref:Uncharacterized protein n=1 Tax=Mytilus galloprovincialis TaxID=29158 RepID=A0A8B6DTZ8_MYTGA|nr:Hypothetical predicted protein [Mytilus galloprovincialis]